jgi:hypothetical protein
MKSCVVFRVLPHSISTVENVLHLTFFVENDVNGMTSMSCDDQCVTFV